MNMKNTLFFLLLGFITSDSLAAGGDKDEMPAASGQRLLGSAPSASGSMETDFERELMKKLADMQRVLEANDLSKGAQEDDLQTFVKKASQLLEQVGPSIEKIADYVRDHSQGK